jgi:hypothetical protein
MKITPKQAKIKKVMDEFKSGTLHSGSKKGATVTNPKQAIAIALSQAKGLKKGGMWIQDAIKKPGSLRKSLGVKEGQTIPKGKLASASKSSNPTTAKRARLAMTLSKLGKGK